QAKPSRKLFSELIREAHVSLRRCNLDKMVTSMQSTCKVKVSEFERPVPTVCPAVDETSTTAACPAPKSPIKPVMSSLESKSNSEPQPEVNARPHKRPALVPLPALARFLSKHQSKHKNVGTRQESLNKAPPEATPPSKTAPCDRSTVGSHPGTLCISPRSTLHQPEPTQEGQVLAPQIVVPKPKVPDCTLVLPSTDLPLSTSEQMDFSTSAPEGLPTAIDSILADITDSSTIAPCVSTNQPASLLPDSSPMGFESLSPISSPEPLPPLHVSLGLETLPSPSAVDTTLKWHSLFPQPDSFLTSYAHFYPTTHSPTRSPRHQPSQEAPSVTPDPFLHGDEYQSLPFPGELSPLNLQLSMSPSFSSLDGGALSPSPSLSDLLSFISNDHNSLLLEAEVVRAEPVLVPCPPPPPLTLPTPRPDPFPPVEPEPEPTAKPTKGRKKGRKGPCEAAPSDSDSVHAEMQPSLEEVEEQLFVSFTSKEALKLHIQEPHDGPAGTQPLESSREDPQPNAPSPEGEPRPQSAPPLGTGEIGATAPREHASSGDVVKDYQESIAAFQTVLLLELKLMKNRQVIHPVLQEVGLKMHLLDSALAIDLQYLGVRLPIPPHPFSLEAQAPTARAASPQTSPRLSVCLDFVSRTGKTSDITQIKGWREKFPPSESSTSSSSSRLEAAVSAEHPSKNLSAFCSDMLDEYLENEGKFLDQHASSFSQAPPEPVAYKLPVQSSSYVRTLGSVMKKQPLSAPTSALISSFVPPSKRARLPPTTTKSLRRDGRQKTAGLKLKAKPAAGTGYTAPTSRAVVSLTPPPAPATSQASLATPPIVPSLTSQTRDKPEAHPPPAKTVPPPVSTPPNAPSKKTKKLKSAQTSPKTPKDLAWGVQNLAPLESDSELGPAADDESPGRAPPPPPPPRVLVSVTLLKQRDLEEAAVWEGRPRTCVTEERASVALTSLFTLAGFVREDPTAPIELVKRPTPACLKDFCLLGCVCSSLAQSRLITHCGKTECMLGGCSCLRQTVVLLKHLDGSDSGPSSDIDPSRRKRKRRMKMAYVLKETESVAQPAQPVRTLWKGGDVDPEPLFTPEHLIAPKKQVRRGAGKKGKTCARVRGYTGRKTLNHARKSEGVQEAEEEHTQILKKKTTAKSTDLSKHLVILAECRWPSTEVQNQVLKAVCQAMAQEKLHKPFRIGKYHVKLLSFNVREGVVHYKVHISEGKADPSKTLPSTTGPGPTRPGETGGEEAEGGDTVQDSQEEVRGERAVEYWQKEVEGEEDVEYWQRAVEGEETEEDAQKEVEEEEALEPWQREVEEEEALEPWQKEVEEEEALEPWQKEMEEEEALEPWQKEVEEEEAEEDPQKEVEEEETEEDPQKEVEEEEALEPWQKEMEEEEALEPWQKEMEEEEALEPWQKEMEEEEALEPWQKEMEEEEALEPWQKEMEEEETEEDARKEVPGEEDLEPWQKEEEEALEPWQKEVEEEEAEEDAQKEVEEEEDPQKEVEEEEAEEDPQNFKEMEADKEDLKEVKKRMMKMALPFLSGLSHAGFLSANLKAAGAGSLLVQVNGKPYPNAMVQLGRMGALHPANRLAAYLTGRVPPPPTTQPPAPPASSMATVSTATSPPASDLQSPRVGTAAGPGPPSSRRPGGRMFRLVPLSQLRNPKGRDGGTPGNNNNNDDEDRKSIFITAIGPRKVLRVLSVAPAPSAGTCRFRLVPAGGRGNASTLRHPPGRMKGVWAWLGHPPGRMKGVWAWLGHPPGRMKGVWAWLGHPPGRMKGVWAWLGHPPGRMKGVWAWLGHPPGRMKGVWAWLGHPPGRMKGVWAWLGHPPGRMKGVWAWLGHPPGRMKGRVGVARTSSRENEGRVGVARTSSRENEGRVGVARTSSRENEGRVGVARTSSRENEGRVGVARTSSRGNEGRVGVARTSSRENEGRVGVARTSSRENEGRVGVARTSSRGKAPRAEHDVVVLSSSDLSDSTSDGKREDGPGDGARRDRSNGHFRLSETECRKAVDVGAARLPKETGLGEQTPNVTTITQAREELLELRSSEGQLAPRLHATASLRRQRGERIRALALRTGRSEASVSRELLRLSVGNAAPPPGRTGSDPPPWAPGGVARMAETDSDEETLPSDTRGYVSSSSSSSIRGDATGDIEASADDDLSNTVDDKKRLVTAYKSLRSELNCMTATQTDLLASAYGVICDLKDEEKLCEKVTAALKRQRDRLIHTLSVRSGRSTRKIMEKLQSITAKQRQLEVRLRPRFRPAETATPLDLSCTTGPRSQRPAPACTAQLDPQPPPPPTARSPHTASRLKTVPNILTRRKPPSPPLSPSPSPPVGWSESREAPAFHTAMMPAGLVSFLCPLPGQQVLTLKHMAYEPGAPPPNPDGPFTTLLYLVPSNTALQPLQELQGPADEEPGSLPQPQTLQAGSLPHPQTLQAGSLPHETLFSAGSQPHQTLFSAGSQPHQTLFSAGAPPPHQTLFSAGSPPPHQTLFSAGAPPPHQTFPAGSIPHPQTPPPSGGPGAKLEECWPRPPGPVLPAAAPPSGTRPALLIPGGGKALSPSPNQLSFLGANIGPPADRTALSSVPGHPCSSLGRGPHKDGPLGPSLSTEDLTTEATQVDGHLQSAAGPEPNGCNALHYPQCGSTSGTLTLPPLLQMNVGGAKRFHSTERFCGGELWFYGRFRPKRTNHSSKDAFRPTDESLLKGGLLKHEALCPQVLRCSGGLWPLGAAAGGVPVDWELPGSRVSVPVRSDRGSVGSDRSVGNQGVCLVSFYNQDGRGVAELEQNLDTYGRSGRRHVQNMLGGL
ncbi:unnamed protein product, partial [Boreogadus saida]